MSIQIKTASILLAALLPLACTVESESSAAKPTGDATTSTESADHIHRVACGCALEEYGSCGNYIEVEGKFVPVGGDLGLGVMEWCGQSGLKAEATGEMQDGTFVATAITVVP